MKKKKIEPTLPDSYPCYDCGKEIKIKDKEVLGGKVLVYDDNGDFITVIKCDECYKQNPSLNNFRTCEVYSRIVGYLRPVQQWNEGKKQEFAERSSFKI